MQLNFDFGVDGDFKIARQALERGWVTRQEIEFAVLAHERTPEAPLLQFLPLNPKQLLLLQTPSLRTLPPELAEVAFEPARQFAHYVLAELLRSGGMCRVYQAWDLKLSRWVALKRLKAVGDERSEAYFEREARLAAGLSHSHIATIFETGKFAGERYIAMQFIEGRTLDVWTGADMFRLARLIRDAARAVDFAHSRGVVHRDLKPPNLIVDSADHLYVLDFGLARDSNQSATRNAMGTPSYMSPEQARGAPADARSDVYGLGATMYHCMTGRAPFTGATIYHVLRRVEEESPALPRRLDSRIPRDLETIVLKCLEKDPGKRYGTASELAADLDRFLNHDPIQARPASGLYRLRRGLAKRKSLVMVSILSAFLLGFLGWWIVIGRPQSERLELREAAMKLWAEARGAEMAAVDPPTLAAKTRAARQAFERVLQGGEDPIARMMRGRCLELEGKSDAALEDLERAHALDGGNPEIRIELAKALMTKYRKARGLALNFGYFKNGAWQSILQEETAAHREWRERSEKLLARGGALPVQDALLKGLVASAKGEYAPAAREFARYLSTEPWDARTMWLQGHCLLHSNDPVGAREAFERSLKRQPTAEAYWGRGWANIPGPWDIPAAIEDFTKAIEIDPRFAEAYYSRAQHLQLFSEPAKAISDYSRAIELDPRHARAFLGRGQVYSSQGKREAAIADFTKAIELSPTYPLPYQSRAESRLSLGRLDDAIADFKKFADFVVDDNGRTWSQLAHAYAMKGSLKESLSYYDLAIERKPADASLSNRRGWVRLRKNLPEEAIADFSKAIEIAPSSPQGWAARAMVQFMSGFVREAKADWEKSIEVARSNSNAPWPRHVDMFRVLNVLTCSKVGSDTAESFRKLLEGHPQSDAVMVYYFAWGYALLGNKEQAVEGFEKAIEMDATLQPESHKKHFRKQVLAALNKL